MDLVYWPGVIQTSIGKLYVLSLFYMINSQSLGGRPQPDNQPTTFISTFTVPTEVLHTLTPREARVGDVASSDVATGRVPGRTIEFAV